MTSKISFSKLVRDEIRKLNWLLALQCLVFLLLIPFRALLVLATARSSVYLLWGSKTLYDVFCENVGLGRLENTVIILGMGIVCAIVAFCYLHSAVQLDLYHSLAVKREKLFAAKYLGGFLSFAIPYMVSQLLTIPAGLCYGVFSCKVTVEILVASLQGILFFLCSYSGALIAVMLTGKLLTTVLALGVLGCYVPMLCLIYIGYRTVFFYTSVSKFSIVNIIKYSSPWTFCVYEHSASLTGQTIRGATGGWPTAGSMLLTLAVAVVLAVIALLLYRVRKTEAAGKALAFKPLEAVVKLLLTIPTAVIAPLFAYELINSVVWEAVFILLFGVLSCMIMEFIYRWDIRQVLCNKLHILITIVAALVIFFSCRMDIMGYNTYLPKEDEIDSMAAAATYMDHLYLDEEGLAYRSSDSDKEILELFESKDFEAYYRLAENGVDIIRSGEGNEYSDTTVSVVVKYSLKNGKEVYREYMVDKEPFLEVFNGMQKNPEFVEAFYPIMTWSRENIAALGGVTFYAENPMQGGAADFTDITENQTEEDSYDGDVELAEIEEGELYHIPDDDIERLVEAYRKDLLAVSFEDAWYEDQVCSLSFVLPARGSGGGEGYLSDTYFINKKFTNTWEVLLDILKDEKPSGTPLG